MKKVNSSTIEPSFIIGTIAAVFMNLLFSPDNLNKYFILRIIFIILLFSSIFPLILLAYDIEKWARSFRAFFLGFSLLSIGFAAGSFAYDTYYMRMGLFDDLYKIFRSIVLAGISTIYERFINYIEIRS